MSDKKTTSAINSVQPTATKPSIADGIRSVQPTGSGFSGAGASVQPTGVGGSGSNTAGGNGGKKS